MSPKQRMKKNRLVWRYYALPIFFIILVVLLRLWVGFVYHVPKDSEALGKYAGRYLLIARIGSPKRGELVLASLENKGKRRDTHRLPLLVAGLPGDTIESYAGVIYVNGKSWFSANAQRNTSSEPKHTASILSDTLSLTSNGADSSYYHLVLRPNEFWLLTYSIFNSMDSRHYGPIHRNRLYGIQAL